MKIENRDIQNLSYQLYDIGGKLKATDTMRWISPNPGATNETGFTALGGGLRNESGTGLFSYFRYWGYWWSATENGAAEGWCRGVSYNTSSIYRNTCIKKHGFFEGNNDRDLPFHELVWGKNLKKSALNN